MKKLLELQKKLNPIIKDSKNPFFKSKYFDINTLIESVKPILDEVGIVLLQPLTHLESAPAIKTMLLDGETGDILLESITPMIQLNDPQKMGSCITYYRRYAIQSMLFLQAEDDDGNSAKNKPKTTKIAVSVEPKNEDKIKALKAFFDPNHKMWVLPDTAKNREELTKIKSIIIKSKKI